MRALVTLCCTLAAAAAGAQPAPGTPLTYELTWRDRYMNAGQLPENTPHANKVLWIAVDSSRPDLTAGVRTTWLHVAEASRLPDDARLQTTLGGRLVDVDASFRPLPRPASSLIDSARQLRFRTLGVGQVRLTLPATHVWDLVPPLPPADARRGTRWTDTLRHQETLRQFRQAVTGTRVSTIVGDTVIAGRSAWIVHDSAAIEYVDHFDIDERTADGDPAIDRRLTGTVIGRHIVDGELQMHRWRVDTTALRGQTTLTYPDGRTFTTPTAYERTRRWDLYEPAALEERRAELQAEREANSFSIVRVPRNELEERLARGDRNVVDSLVQVLTASRDADERASAQTLLRSWNRDSATLQRVHDARVASADTAYMISSVTSSLRRRLDDDAVRLLLPFARDPGLALRHGVSRDATYEAFLLPLSSNPPIPGTDTSQWGCTPSACATVAGAMSSPGDRRLRAVGLAVRALLDPARWRDTFLLAASTDSAAVSGVLRLMRGIGNVAPAAIHLPVPGPDAAWSDWRDWLYAPNPDYARPTTLPPRGLRQPLWFTAQGNPNGIRIVAAATGRDIVAELRRLYDAAPNDTARVVTGRILASLGASPLSIDDIERLVVSDTALMHVFALQRLGGVGGSTGQSVQFVPADTSLSAELQSHLLTSIVGRVEPWRTLDQWRGGQPFSVFQNPPTDAPGATHTVYFARDNLRPTVVTALSGRAQFLTTAEWDARPLREGGELWTLSDAERAGPFVRLSYRVSGRIHRSGAQGPQAWASGVSYLLLRVGDEWVVVTKSAWVT